MTLGMRSNGKAVFVRSEPSKVLLYIIYSVSEIAVRSPYKEYIYFFIYVFHEVYVEHKEAT